MVGWGYRRASEPLVRGWECRDLRHAFSDDEPTSRKMPSDAIPRVHDAYTLTLTPLPLHLHSIPAIAFCPCASNAEALYASPNRHCRSGTTGARIPIPKSAMLKYKFRRDSSACLCSSVSRIQYPPYRIEDNPAHRGRARRFSGYKHGSVNECMRLAIHNNPAPLVPPLTFL